MRLFLRLPDAISVLHSPPLGRMPIWQALKRARFIPHSDNKFFVVLAMLGCLPSQGNTGKRKATAHNGSAGWQNLFPSCSRRQKLVLRVIKSLGLLSHPFPHSVHLRTPIDVRHNLDGGRYVRCPAA
jgi:hypothetical protein